MEYWLSSSSEDPQTVCEPCLGSRATTAFQDVQTPGNISQHPGETRTAIN